MTELRKVNLAEIVIGCLFILYYAVTRHFVGGGISILYVWVLMGSVLIAKGLIYLIFGGRLWVIFDIAFAVFLISVSIFLMGISTYGNSKPEKTCDYIIVLGARVNSDVLQKRIDSAYDYLNKNPSALAVCTGGRGEDEEISEGEFTAECLTRAGISKSRLIVESKSKTTAENIIFGVNMMNNPQCIGIVTTDFHMFRSYLTLKSHSNANIQCIPSRFEGILVLHYMLREYITFAVDLTLGNIRL